MNTWVRRHYAELVGWLSLLGFLLITMTAQAAEPVSWSMNDALDYALAHNPDLQVAASSIDELEQARGEVFANFLPDLKLEGGYTYIDNIPQMEIDMKVQTPIPGMEPIAVNKKIDMGYHDNYQAQLKLNQILFASGQVYYADRAMQKAVAAGESQLAAARLKVTQMTAQAYLGVLIAQQVATAQHEALANAREHLKHVENRYQYGAATKFELLRAQVEVSNLEPQATEADKNVQLARTMLSRATGLPADASLTLTDKLVEPTAADAQSDYHARALAQRPELDAYRLSADANEDQALARRGSMLPAVMLMGSYGYSKPYYMNDDWETNWTVGVGVSIPLFDGLQGYRGMKRAQAQAETANRQRSQVAADVRTQVEQALLDQDEARVRIVETKNNLDRAAQMLIIAEDSYKAGAVTSLEVIDAQLAATAAQVAHLKALYDYRVARVNLAAATGDLSVIGR
ncbi:MAG TPA: TolC family protein [bacterium]|nr:TolC family protein [bacterium]